MRKRIDNRFNTQKIFQLFHRTLLRTVDHKKVFHCVVFLEVTDYIIEVLIVVINMLTLETMGIVSPIKLFMLVFQGMCISVMTADTVIPAPSVPYDGKDIFGIFTIFRKQELIH
ncbi:hypothetical protein BOW51_10745 [Solemya velesiana gill symbiont]|uniref:Uncharacterized protein n=1 Tax=Solemya velesiana gill symbiont TaxID=1918948 RepID=A0A1T2KS52_9GAMM|nr:hypothetical protein BOW51_10745 [Solemya velesiana gill symbiont]